MDPEILSVVLTGAGVLIGVWRMHVQTNNRIDGLERHMNGWTDALSRDVGEIRERMAQTGGSRVDRLTSTVSALMEVIIGRPVRRAEPVMMARRICWLGVVLVLATGAAFPAVAQERSVGVSVGPSLKLYDEGWACCMSVGAWLQVGRFQIEHEIGLNVWHVRAAARYDRSWHEPLDAEGWATTASWNVKTWRTARATTRIRAALAHRRNSGSRGFAPDFYTLNVGWTFNVGLAVDFPTGGRRPFVRTGLRGPFPEPQVGVGFPF